MNKLQVAIFISGRGSNLESLIQSSFKKQSLVEVQLVVSNNSKAKGLTIAKKNKIPFIYFIPKKNFENKVIKYLNNIDITVIKDGFHGDTSKMFIIGKPSVKAQKICNVARESMMLAIDIVKPGIHLGEIGKVIGDYAHSKNCSVVRDYCGHGIGEVFHELPQVIHYDDGKINQSPILEPGMTFTIEPMINLGGYEVVTSRIDGWTVTTKDRSLSAQWEHTILVTETGHEILTLREEEK